MRLKPGKALRHPAVVAGLLPGLRIASVRQGPLAYGPLSSGRIDPALPGERTFVPLDHPGELATEITTMLSGAVARES